MHLSVTHLDSQPVHRDLHLQCNSSWHDTLASGRLVHIGCHLSGCVQPQSPGDGRWRYDCDAAPQSCPPCSAVLLMCWCSAASDGGRAAIGRHFRVSSSFLVSFMDTDVLVLSYMSMVNRSKAEYTSSDISSEAPRSSQKDAVTSSCVSHTFHAVFLPTCAKWDTVSQPVKAWNTGSARYFLGPNEADISWAGTERNYISVHNAIHISLMPSSCNVATANTTTLVSTVRTRILLNPRSAASAICSIILESASSWLHGDILTVFRAGLQCMPSPYVMTSSWSACIVTISSSLLRNVNNSTLFVLTLRNCCQFFGTGDEGSTLYVRFETIVKVLIPYNINTASLLQFPIYVRNNTFEAYSLNVLQLDGLSMFTNTAPTMIATSLFGRVWLVDWASGSMPWDQICCLGVTGRKMTREGMAGLRDWKSYPCHHL